RLFSHMSERLSGTATSLGLAGVVGLAIAGEGLLAALLLAGFGAAAAVLIVSGVLRLRPKESRTETRLREIFGALPSALAVTDRRGALLWKSDTFMKAIGGLGLEQDLTRLGERNQEAASAMFRLFAAARAGHVHLEAIRLPQSPGDEHYTLKVSPLVEHGRRARTFIWELKEADGARNAEEPGAAAILNKVPLPAFSIAKDLSVEGANKNFEALLGRSPAGEQAWSLFSTKRGKPLTRAWLRDMIAKGGDQTSARLSSPGGAAHLLTLSFSKDAGGRVLCIAVPAGMGVELEDGFDQLLPYAPLPMALLNPKGVIQTANVAFHQLFDSSCLGGATGLLGKPLQSLVSEASSKNIRDKITAVLAAAHNPQSQTVELQVELLDPGSKRLRLVMFLAAQGNRIIVAASSAESAALIGEQAAQSQKLQAVGELAGGIAHDFNNLLTAIIGYSDLLLRRFRASDPAFKDLMNIKNSATRAAELVKQILAYSRRQTLRPALVRLTDVIEEFQATIGRTLGEKVRASIRHGRDLWFVKADEGQLFQVIMNLAVNARDAMPDGGEITIKTANIGERESLELAGRGLSRGEYVLCEVSDTGTGIPAEHLERIFDPFFSTKEIGQGTGLGLSTVYGIVKQTGGTIILDSKIGVGTTFRIYLPRYVETEEDLKALESKAEVTDKIADLTGSGTVLLVEDEEAVRSFASRALSTRGYTVLEAASGIEALGIMDRENGKVDLVVSDVVMPEMDGPTLLRHLRERNPNIRIVFMSGYAEEAFRKNLTAEEKFIFLPKPFTLKKLAETVKAAAA
ncbi:MAG: ATP-binding protein, partial [Rhodomicrobium sp.]